MNGMGQCGRLAVHYLLPRPVSLPSSFPRAASAMRCWWRLAGIKPATKPHYAPHDERVHYLFTHRSSDMRFDVYRHVAVVRFPSASRTVSAPNKEAKKCVTSFVIRRRECSNTAETNHAATLVHCDAPSERFLMLQSPRLLNAMQFSCEHRLLPYSLFIILFYLLISAVHNQRSPQEYAGRLRAAHHFHSLLRLHSFQSLPLRIVTALQNRKHADQAYDELRGIGHTLCWMRRLTAGLLSTI